MKMVPLLVLVTAIGCVLLSSNAAYAYTASGDCYRQPRGNNNCSETAVCGTNDVFSGRSTSCAGSALSTGWSKANFISFITNAYNSGSGKNWRGAQFVVGQMTGAPWGSAGNLTTWTNDMNSPNIFISFPTIQVCNTSYYDTYYSDDFYSSAGGCVTRRVLEVSDGSTVYADLEVPCGNLVAGPIKLPPPPPQWSLTPGTGGPSNANPRPTQKVDWVYRARNDGPDATDRWVQLNEDRRVNGSFIGGYQTKWIGPGWGAYTWTSNYPDSWTPAEGDDGKQVCVRAAVNPSNWRGAGWVVSGWSCATAWQEWNTSVTSSETYTTLMPGTTIQWTHTVTNTGPDWTSYGLGWTVNQSPASPNTRTSSTSGTIGSPWTVNSPKTFTNTYTITPSDAGKQLCQNIKITNSAWRLTASTNRNNGNTKQSASACVTIPYNYGLTPTITAPSQLDSGQQATVTSNINNPGPTDSQSTNWTISQLVYAPGTTPASQAGGDSTSNPCAFFSSGAPTCTQIASGGPMVISPPGYSPPQQNPTLTYPVGTMVCYALSLNPYFQSAATSNTWRHSALACVTIAKHPKLQITGGDIRTNSDIDTSQMNIGGTYYGSWVEYGAFAGVGSNQGPRFGSGATLRQGSTIPASGAYAVNPLTFANSNLAAPQNGPYGVLNDTSLSSLSPLYGFMNGNGLGISAASPNVIGSLTTMNGDYNFTSSSSPITISGGTIPAGSTIEIRSGGTVTITGDILYASASGNISNYPQLIITAKNINIVSGVKTIDAWLLTSGLIDTCSDVPDVNANASSHCNDSQLTINGPVVAAKGHFKRTAGSDSPATDANPAEWMNLPNSAYLWEYGQASGHVPLMTVQVTQLPPRY